MSKSRLMVGVVVLGVALAAGAAFAIPRLLAGPAPSGSGAVVPAEFGSVTAEVAVEGVIPGSDAARWGTVRERSVADAYVDAVAELVHEETENGSYSFSVRIVEADGDPATVESLVEVFYEMGNQVWVVYQHADGTPDSLDVSMAAEGTWSGAYLEPGSGSPAILTMVWPGIGEGEGLYLPVVDRVVFDGGTAAVAKLYSIRVSGDEGARADDQTYVSVPEYMGHDWWEAFQDFTAASLKRNLTDDVKAAVEGFHAGQRLGFDDYVTQSLAYMGSLRQQTLAEVDSSPTFEEGGEATSSEIRAFLRDFYARPLSLPAPPAAAVTTPPAGIPSCPAGMAPVSWTEYDDGSILLCALGGRVSVVYASASPGRAPTAVRFVGDGYVLQFPDGTLTYDGGQVVVQDASGRTSVHRADAAWVVGRGDQAAPAGQAVCPAGSRQISRSTWADGWLLVCGTDQGVPTRLEYSDSRKGQGSSGEVQGGDEAHCADVSGTVACVYRGGGVTLDGEPRQVSRQDWPGPDATEPDSPNLAPGTWVTVLQSLNKRDVPLADAYAMAGQLSAQWGVDVYVFDSSVTPGMNAGYWALTLISFPSNDAARAACSWVGRVPGDECYGRQITG